MYCFRSILELQFIKNANKGLSLSRQPPDIKFRQRPIFPGRLQPSIVSTGELNFCVRNGNRCDLSVIATGNFMQLSKGCACRSPRFFNRLDSPVLCAFAPSKPYNDLLLRNAFRELFICLSSCFTLRSCALTTCKQVAAALPFCSSELEVKPSTY